ncbi:MAG: 3-dehydroquinate synthase [Lachnospiraceae bacterium]|nr:3-dehydroquinate synthase [Lachnospiraceae bacterium]
MKKVHINKTVTGDAYDIIVTEGFDSVAGEISSLDHKPGALALVADSNVDALYGDEVEKALKVLNIPLYRFSFQAGEPNKTLDTVRSVLRFLIENHLDRKSMVIALGGGVTGDLVGFASSVFLRGIPFVQIPTSLLADTDSSIGGKTGVDFDEFKNMVGAFHMPGLVHINVDTLKTLNKREFSSGMAEIIKHGLIQDRAYYEKLKSLSKEILSGEGAVMMDIIHRSCEIKAGVVEEDPTEKGIRAILNFGHTLGHAIEKYKKFELTHGECVALGSVAAAYISFKRGYITQRELEDIKEVFSMFSLPVRIGNIDINEIIRITKSDKKMESGKIKFILLKSIGEAVIDKSVTDEEMAEALAYIG